MKTTLIYAMIALLLVSACGETSDSDTYLSRFAKWDKEKIEYDPELLGEVFDSPHGLGKVYPIGKVDVGEGIILALVGKSEDEKAYGEVIAELFVEGNRISQLSLAEADMGIFVYTNLDLPGLVRWKESEDGPAKGEKFLISRTGFTAIP